MIRVLHVVPRLFAGGEQTLIMNWYRNINRNNVQFDFVVCHDEKGVFEDEVIKLGGIIYHSPRYNGKNHLKYVKWWDKFFFEHGEIAIVHGHLRSTATIYLSIAKKYGMYTIAHSHSISNGKGFEAIMKNALQFPLRYIADYMMGCSDAAGQYLFGRSILNNHNYITLPNAINCTEFAFDSTKREQIRNNLLLGNNTVIGQVGRFHTPKNHNFTINIFYELVKKHSDYILLLIGDGELRPNIEEKCKEYGIEEKVIFVGVKTNVSDYYQAMDVLMFPSLFEGLGIVAIEAQASGLKCICSNKVPKDVVITDLCYRFSLDDKEKWILEIEKLSNKNRRGYSEIVKKAGYDIQETASWLEKFYINSSRRQEK